MPTYISKFPFMKKSLENTIVCFFIIGTIMILKYSKNSIDRETNTPKPQR